MANTVSYIYEILDRYSAPLRKISKQTRKFAGFAKRAQKGVLNLSKKMDNLASKAQNLQGALGALGLAAGLKKVIDVSSEMEDAMSDIGRVTDVSASGLLQFEDQLEKISEQLGKSKKGLAEMAFEGGKLGVPIEKMEDFLMMTSRTAIAFDMLDQEAGRAIGSIQAKMGLMGEESERLLDSTNFLADTTSANGARMIEIIERLSGTFKLLEIPPEVSAALAGFADQIEVTPQLAASGMNMMIRQMRKMPGMTTKLMNDPIAAINTQLERMAKMGPELRTRFVQKVFGAESARFVEKAIANIELFGSTVEKATSSEAAGSMQRELENQMKRSSKAFEIFSATVTNTFDTIGDVIKPFAVNMAKSFSVIMRVVREFAKANPILVKFLAGFAAVIVVFTGLAATVGVLMAAMAPLTAFLATFALPIIGIVAGITALSVAFSEWVETGHPVIAMLGDMASDIGSILLPLGEMLGLVGESVGGFDILSDVINKFGHAIIAILTPVRVLLKSLSGVVQMSSAVASGDFSSVMDIAKSTFTDVANIGSEGFSSLGSVVGMDNANAAAGKSSPQQVNVSGNIGVSAAGGAKIDNAEINLNGGGNMAMAGG